jgi:hypothetical protein
MSKTMDMYGPGTIVPADGNYSTQPVIPNGAERSEESLFNGGAAKGEREISRFARNDGSDPGDEKTATARLDLGPNNERLEDAKPELVNALRELVRQYRREGVVAWRHEIRRIRQARLFWQGLQYAWWNPNDMNWHLPFEQRFSDDRELEEMPRYQFVTNFYQGFGLSFIAVLSQDVPSVRFYPQSAQSLEDISAARAASDVATLIEQNNQVEHLLTSIGYFLWTDGKLGAYVRYVADGQRFGFHEEHVLEPLEIPLGEDVYVCPECGKETLADQYSNQSESTDDASVVGAQHAAPQQATNCPDCGAELTEENLRKAERVTMPRIAGTRRVPNGQEVISIAGGLELNTPVWANEMHEYPYLQWQAEVHRAKLKAAYPHAADKIESSPSQGSEDVYARVSRLSVEQGLPSIHPGDALMNLITFDRTWLRPWAFYAIEDAEVRSELLTLFPDGCYVAFAGEAYCEARSENMDDHWRVLHALPGDGQNRPSVGDSLVQVQERYNVLSNMQAETYEYGIPPIYADPQVLDFDALANQIAEPAAHFPARASGTAARGGIFPAGAGASSSGHAAPPAGPDRSGVAIPDRAISRHLWREHGGRKNRQRLCAGARPGHGPPGFGLAADETVLCRRVAVGGGLLPQEPPRRRGDPPARARRRARCANHSRRGFAGQHLRASGGRRDVSAAEVATARRVAAIVRHQRPDDSARADRAGEYRLHQERAWAYGVGGARRGFAQQTVARDSAAPGQRPDCYLNKRFRRSAHRASVFRCRGAACCAPFRHVVIPTGAAR